MLEQYIVLRRLGGSGNGGAEHGECRNQQQLPH
jgi:hypothetical protein